MSRQPRPSRHWTLFARWAGLCAAALSGALALSLAGASAQDTVSRTVIGGSRAPALCARLAGTGDGTDRALEACTRALGADLTDADRVGILVNRGIIYLRRGQGEPALADFDAAIAVNPRSAEAHVNRGAALVSMQRPGPAVAALTQALSLGVAEPYKAYYNRGAAREALGDLRGAFEDYSTALEIHPDWAPAEAEIARFVRARHEHLAATLSDDPASQ